MTHSCHSTGTARVLPPPLGQGCVYLKKVSPNRRLKTHSLPSGLLRTAFPLVPTRKIENTAEDTITFPQRLAQPSPPVKTPASLAGYTYRKTEDYLQGGEATGSQRLASCAGNPHGATPRPRPWASFPSDCNKWPGFRTAEQTGNKAELRPTCWPKYLPAPVQSFNRNGSSHWPGFLQVAAGVSHGPLAIRLPAGCGHGSRAR